MNNYYRFTQTEKVDMLLIYGEARKNSYLAMRLYQERYPNRPQPSSRNYFAILESQFRKERNNHDVEQV